MQSTSLIAFNNQNPSLYDIMSNKQTHFIIALAFSFFLCSGARP